VARTYVALARAEGLPLPAPDVGALLAEVRDLEARIEPFLPTFCHNDLMPANLLDTGDRVWVIDWEYAGIGHPLFDLAGLSSNGAFDAAQDSALLAAYGVELAPDDAQLTVMKAMAALRESLWAVVQGSQSAIDFDYGAYRDDSYAKYRAALALTSGGRRGGRA
jgi:thiamine kinase-like enzyme